MFHVKRFAIITFALCQFLLSFSRGTQESFVSRLLSPSCIRLISSGDLYNILLQSAMLYCALKNVLGG